MVTEIAILGGLVGFLGLSVWLGRFIRGSAPGWAREPAPDDSRGRYA